jgi:hypothetical protein
MEGYRRRRRHEVPRQWLTQVTVQPWRAANYRQSPEGQGPTVPGGYASGRSRRGTYGNMQAYVRHAGADLTPPLDWRHPEIAHPADRLPSDQSCR